MSIPSAHSFWRTIGCVIALSGFPATGGASERQHHGVAFEKWVRDTFFDGYIPADYTQKWDIPAQANRRHGGIPVNPKAVKYGSPLDLGDALRQFDIEEPFWLVIGYWQQEEEHKRMVNITAVRVNPATWRALWGPVTRADIEQFDALIKDRSLAPEEARRLAQERKSQPPFDQSVIAFNPKIDWKTQRRLQCSLRFSEVFQHLAPGADSAPQAVPVLWGVPFPGMVE